MSYVIMDDNPTHYDLTDMHPECSMDVYRPYLPCLWSVEGQRRVGFAGNESTKYLACICVRYVLRQRHEGIQRVSVHHSCKDQSWSVSWMGGVIAGSKVEDNKGLSKVDQTS